LLWIYRLGSCMKEYSLVAGSIWSSDRVLVHLITLFACQGAAPRRGQALIYARRDSPVNPLWAKSRTFGKISWFSGSSARRAVAR